MAKTNHTGEIALAKADNDMFTRAWTIVDAMPNLDAEDRAAMDRFGDKWFDGSSLYVHSPVFVSAFAVLTKHTELKRKVRAGKVAPERMVDWTPPEHNPDYRDSSPWPKYRTRELIASGLNYRAYRAWYRCKVRDEVRAGLSIEQSTLVKLRDENIALKQQVARVDELEETIASMQTVMQEILDEVEQVKLNVKPARTVQHHRMLDWVSERRAV